MKWIIEKDFKGHAKAYISDETGTDPCTNKTEAEYLAEGFISVTDQEFIKLVNDYQNSLCGDWREISQEYYEERLYELPPADWRDGGFYCSECDLGDVASFYQKLGDKYYASLQRRSTPRAKIFESLKAFIEGEDDE